MKKFSLLICLFVLPAMLFAGGGALEGVISVVPLGKNQNAESIRAGTAVKLFVTVKNVGTIATPPGKIFLRFAFTDDLADQPNSVLYESEEEPLKSILPGQEIVVSFGKPHQWPSLTDFIRYDWGLRKYQAVVSINDKQSVIGSLMIAYTANYYPGQAETHRITPQ